MLVEVCLTFSFLSLPTPFLSSGLVWTGCEREREEANTQSNTKNARHGINKFAHNSGPRTSRNRSHIAIIFFFPLQTIIELRMIFGLQVRWGRQISNSSALFSLRSKLYTYVPLLNVQLSLVASQQDWNWVAFNAVWSLTLSLPRVIYFELHLQPHQNINITTVWRTWLFIAYSDERLLYYHRRIEYCTAE